MEYQFNYPCFCEKDQIKMEIISSSKNTTLLVRVSTLCETCKETCSRLSHLVKRISSSRRYLIHYQDEWMNLFKFPLSSAKIYDIVQPFDSYSATLLVSKQRSKLDLFLWLQHYPSLSTMNNLFLILNIKDSYLKLRIDIVKTYFLIKGESIPAYL